MKRKEVRNQEHRKQKYMSLQIVKGVRNNLFSFSIGALLLGVFSVSFSGSFVQAETLPVSPQVIPKDASPEARILTREQFDALSNDERRTYLQSLNRSRSSTTPQISRPTLPEGATSCFEYYRFGSVQVDISPTLLQTVPGVPMTFKGKIKNANKYPIVDGQVYAKIFYTGKGGDAFSHHDGYPLVDFILVKDSIVINAETEQDIAFDWQVPHFARGGEYNISMFFTSAKRYSLLGLTFTDDVVGNQTTFKVTSDSTSAPVTFNKTNVRLNSTDFDFASPPPFFTRDEQVTAFATLTNPSDTEHTVSVTWITSVWDGILKENERKREAVLVQLKPHESKEISYAPPVLDATVTYLVAELADRDTKSILNIRFVRNGIEETALTLPTITRYPLAAGEENTLFSCANSTNIPIVQGTTITLALADTEGRLIESYTYEGDITGDMMGVKKDFIPAQTYSDFTLTATMERHGKILEKVVQKYSCRDIDPSLCPKNDASITAGTGPAAREDFIKSITGKGVAIWLIALLSLLGFALIIGRKLKGKSQGPPVAPLMLFFMLAISFFSGAEQAGAKSVTYSGTAFPTDGCWGINMSYSISYKANVYNDSAGGILLNDGDIIPTGTRIRFQDGPYLDSDISWFGTGWTSSSPYGAWVAASGRPSADKFSPYVEPFIGTHTGVLSVNFPINYTVTHIGTAGLSCNSSGTVCTVTSPGSINAQVNFVNRPAEGITSLDGGCNDGWVLSSKIDYSSGYPMPIGGGYDYDWSGNNITFWGAYDRGWVVPPSNPYVLSNYDYSLGTYRTTSGIPSQTIPFTLAAVAAATPPAVPILSVDAFSKLINTDFIFTAQTSDPDNDTLRYGFDWNNDSVIDQWVPGAGYVSSGTAQSALHQWVVAGTYSIKALAEDVNGAQSAWSVPVTVTTTTAPPLPTIDFKINNSAGSVDLIRGDMRNISWTVADATVCNASSGDGFSGAKSIPSGSESRAANMTSLHTLSCTGPGGSTSSSIQVNVSCIPSIGIYGACDCSTETKTRTNITAACLSSVETTACDSAEKNACRNFNWVEVAP